MGKLATWDIEPQRKLVARELQRERNWVPWLIAASSLQKRLMEMVQVNSRLPSRIYIVVPLQVIIVVRLAQGFCELAHRLP
jgi:hypothetical protein